MIFPWFFGSSCDCSGEISRLRRTLERIEETRKFENSTKKVFATSAYIDPANNVPVERKKFEFDYQYYQDNAPDYECRGGVDGQIPTEFSSSDIDNVVVEHLKEVRTEPISFTFLLLVPLDLSKNMSDLDPFIHLYEYPAYSKDTYENEWGRVGNTRILLYNDEGLKNNRKSESRHPKLDSGQKVYSSFMVSTNEKNEIQKVTHMKSTRN